MKCVCGHDFVMHNIRLIGPTTCINCDCATFEKAPADGFEDIEWVNQP